MVSSNYNMKSWFWVNVTIAIQSLHSMEMHYCRPLIYSQITGMVTFSPLLQNETCCLPAVNLFQTSVQLL